MIFFLAAVLQPVIVSTGWATSSSGLKLSSPAFSEGKPIPRRYAGQGEDFSPPLQWTGIPGGTKQLALICDDPDAPGPEPWVHWIVYGIAPSVMALPEHLPSHASLSSPVKIMQGTNSFNKVGYNGPLPPPGEWHRYYFKLYALDARIDVPAAATAQQLQGYMKGHVIGEARLMGKYRR